MVQINNTTYVVGDIHGDISLLSLIIENYDISNVSLILLGDIGIWRYRDYKRYISLDKVCAKRNIDVYAFRGNHDNPLFFLKREDQSPIARRFWDKFTNFKLLPDLTKIIINGATGIVIGGGTSIDRCCRRTWQSSHRYYNNLYKLNDWWENEIVPNTDNINDKVDFILSHTGPRSPKIAPLTKDICNFFKLDKELEADIMIENQRIEELQKQFKPKKWWFGHYHINDSFDFLETRCIVVDIATLSPLIL